MARAESWVFERLNGEDGLGGIFPAMVNAHEALSRLGYSPTHPACQTTKRALQKLLVIDESSAYCQPCLSPIWDTGIACLALTEVSPERPLPQVNQALDWIKARQILDVEGDWIVNSPGVRPGGWAFEYRNDHYPDLDDTALVVWAMAKVDRDGYRFNIERAIEWIVGMQSRNGGFAAFDKDNTDYYLNQIPFADHGALLDPPSVDVSARCLICLKGVGFQPYKKQFERCLRYLIDQQEAAGCWYGRWGTNYIYGTWWVLSALEQVGVSVSESYIQKAVAWLKYVQRDDGGWGESNDSYTDPNLAGFGGNSTSFQTAWALLGLMAAGEVSSPHVRRGVEYLLRTQAEDGLWYDEEFTAPGFPRVFYLKYHGYSASFPLWALARYRNLGGTFNSQQTNL